jgi:hypothetical protein
MPETASTMPSTPTSAYSALPWRASLNFANARYATQTKTRTSTTLAIVVRSVPGVTPDPAWNAAFCTGVRAGLGFSGRDERFEGFDLVDQTREGFALSVGVG